ncbi:MAG TPA: DUF6036 family nucleotidyltransferase [Rhodanobacteraceae bacterium]
MAGSLPRIENGLRSCAGRLRNSFRSFAKNQRTRHAFAAARHSRARSISDCGWSCCVQRAQLEHLIRAAGAVTGSRRLIVIGSQAILGEHPNDAPPEAMRSREADLIPIDAPETADLLTGALGELSAFDEAFGYHADGVDLTTATLPDGWRERLIPIDNPNTHGYVGLCLEVHDLLVSKYVAGREKDREFCRAVVRAGFVDRTVLTTRLSGIVLEGRRRELIEAVVDADFSA